MTEVEVVRAGPLALVVDRGRNGHRDEGVASGGALDALAYETANRMVGNASGEAAIETPSELAVRFSDDVRFAIAGAEVQADLDGARVDGWSAQEAPAGSTLTLRVPSSGVRAYLALAGGIDVPAELGSRGTDLTAGFGGFDGRALRAGDRLRVNLQWRRGGRLRIKPPQWDFARDAFSAPALPIRAIPGAEYDALPFAARERVWSAIWSVSPRSNRMGYRLAGDRIANDLAEMRSHGVFPGVIQLPPSGEPIVLLADAQVTGGYPKIGVAIAADLWKLAQARAGDRVRFVRCSVDEAARARAEIVSYLDGVDKALAFHEERAT